ncbi:MAG: LysR family transcriptional regulator [Minwuia thermotolerans]|nr:MAG: LysR family transcriptional regulator [Minwuia thermotolerans]
MDWSDMPPLATLRSFEAAARHLNFTAAGREMNVTHAAVSQQVRRLEERLGVSLMVREGRGLALTDDGARLAWQLSDGFGTLQQAIAAFTDNETMRALKVTVTPIFATSWLMPRIADFRASYPDIELMLNPTFELMDLRRDNYDLAIRYGLGRWPRLESEPLIPSSFVVVAATSLVGNRRILEPSDAADLPWLQELGTDELKIWMERRGVVVPRKKNITHLPGYMIMSALRDGQGVACTARVFVEEDIQEGRLTVLFEDEEGDELNPAAYHMVWQPGPMRAPLKAFVTWLKQVAKADPGA